MAREFPTVQFERYCDDIIVHARSERETRQLRATIAARLAECGLALNERKTCIVYCKDENRKGSYEHEQFTFCSYTFRPRPARNRAGVYFVNFLPAVSDDCAKAIRRAIKRWRLHLWSGRTLAYLAREINPIVRAGSTTTAASTRRGCSGLSGSSTSTSLDGPCGSTSGSVAVAGRCGRSWSVSLDASRGSSFTGRRAAVSRAGWWEPGESRGSRRVL
jgi:hypothetical protein